MIEYSRAVARRKQERDFTALSAEEILVGRLSPSKWKNKRR